MSREEATHWALRLTKLAIALGQAQGQMPSPKWAKGLKWWWAACHVEGRLLKCGGRWRAWLTPHPVAREAGLEVKAIL